MKLFKKKEKGFESKRVGVISDIDYKQKSVKIVYWLIFVFAVLVAFVCIAPPLWVILSSFKDTKEFYQIPPTLFPKTWDFSKLTNAWKTLDFLKYYKNTFIITIGSILSAIIFNGLAGYVLSKLKPKGWTVVFAVIMGSMMIPAQVSMVPTYINIVNLHMLNTYWPMILMAGYNAFLTIVFKSFFDGIPSALIEAAQIDGCTRLGVFFRIVLPLSKAVMFTAAILSFNAAWGDFFWPLLVLKDRSVYTIMVEVLMTAKEYLNQLITMDNRINRKQQRLATLRDVAMNTTPNYADEAVQRTREKSPLENIMSKIVDLDREIDEDIDALVDFKAEVWEQLDKIPDERYKRILWLRYADRKTWGHIASEINFSTRYIHKMHSRALDELDKIL